MMLLAITTSISLSAAEAREGLYLGAGMVLADMGGAVNAQSTIYSGDGGVLTAGFGVNKYLAVEANAWSTEHDVTGGGQIDLKAAQLGMKATLPFPDDHVEPYLAIGAGKYVLAEKRGEGWWYGMGIDIGLTRAFSLAIGFTQHMFDLGADPRESAEATTMTISITYTFL